MQCKRNVIIIKPRNVKHSTLFRMALIYTSFPFCLVTFLSDLFEWRVVGVVNSKHVYITLMSRIVTCCSVAIDCTKQQFSSVTIRFEIMMNFWMAIGCDYNTRQRSKWEAPFCAAFWKNGLFPRTTIPPKWIAFTAQNTKCTKCHRKYNISSHVDISHIRYPRRKNHTYDNAIDENVHLDGLYGCILISKLLFWLEAAVIIFVSIWLCLVCPVDVHC